MLFHGGGTGIIDTSKIISPARRISEKMGSIISQRVALLIMLVVIVLPFLTLSTVDNSGMAFISFLSDATLTDGYSASQWTAAAGVFRQSYPSLDSRPGLSNEPSPLWLKLPNIPHQNCPTGLVGTNETALCIFLFYGDEVSFERIRVQNRLLLGVGGTQALFDYTKVAALQSAYTIASVSIVIVLLVGFTASINLALNVLVVVPIARIMHTLRSSTEAVLHSIRHVAQDDSLDTPSFASEADLVENIVNMLAQLVQRITSNKMHDVLKENAGHIDDSTAAWLSSNYSGASADVVIDHARTSLRAGYKASSPPQAIEHSSIAVDVDVLFSFTFDVLSVDVDVLCSLMHVVFDRAGVLSEFGVDSHRFATFIDKVRAGYRTEPQYHTFHHACDVAHTTYMLLTASGFSASCMTKLELFTSLVSALGHDLGHPGQSNNFLIKTKHRWALQYNDRSPLENMHSALLFDILREPTTNVFVNLSESQWLECRKQVIATILSTDMALHFDNLKKLELFVEVNSDSFATFVAKRHAGTCTRPDYLNDPSNIMLLLETFVHAADLSNPTKPLATYQQWVSRICDEFYLQGDIEKSIGVTVSPMCDRETTSVSNMQTSFIDFVVSPLFQSMFMLFPVGLRELSYNLKSNYEFFALKRIDEVPKEREKILAGIERMEQRFRVNN